LSLSKLPLPSEIMSLISCLWRHHSPFAITEHPCIYYCIINYPDGSQLIPIDEIQNLLWRFYSHNQFMYYLNFCTAGSFTPFTNCHIFNKDIYLENMTVIEIEKTLKFPPTDFRHLVCRHNTFVFVLKANLHTVDQLDLAICRILVCQESWFLLSFLGHSGKTIFQGL